MQACDRKSSRPGERLGPAYEQVVRDGQPVIVLRSFALAREFLRIAEGTRQAGFEAQQIYRGGGVIKFPVLYQEGAEHRAQRREIARFFTPRAVEARYRDMIGAWCDSLIGWAARQPLVALDRVTSRLAMRVVSRVVGLTEADIAGLERRLEVFFTPQPGPDAPLIPRTVGQVAGLANLGRFYARDVRPAIRARRRSPQDDLISHLLAKGYHDRDIVTEAITYGAAGMVTTRQFLTMATWHLVERPDLRERFLAADSPGRQALLAEIIRVESVASVLLRNTLRDVEIGPAGGRVTIPVGALVEIDLGAVNADTDVFGHDSLAIRPGRDLPPRIPLSGLSFGDGHHSCPGEYLALEETEIFLDKLFAHEVEIVQEPTITWDPVVRAYDLADFLVALH
ncbi:MAG: cytochrome P450 [Tetrasphaera sp.]|nr:cytochrome P450 [Tetrasphaera sp.]